MIYKTDIPAVVPAAGLGERMRALCGDRPKELIPVAGWASIEHSLAEALQAGVRRMAVVVRPDKPLLREFLAGERPDGLGEWRYQGDPVDYRGRFDELLFVEQPYPVGLADAVERGRRALGALAVACLMPDNVAVPPSLPIAACLEAYRATGLTALAALRVGEAEASRFANCGGLEVEERPDGLLKVLILQGKGEGAFRVGPAGEALRSMGRTVVSERFFELLEAGRESAPQGEFDDVPLFQALAQEGELLAAPFEGVIFDVGRPEGYEAAVAGYPS